MAEFLLTNYEYIFIGERVVLAAEDVWRRSNQGLSEVFFSKYLE